MMNQIHTPRIGQGPSRRTAPGKDLDPAWHPVDLGIPLNATSRGAHCSGHDTAQAGRRIKTRRQLLNTDIQRRRHGYVG